MRTQRVAADRPDADAPRAADCAVDKVGAGAALFRHAALKAVPLKVTPGGAAGDLTERCVQ
jgi:hypothetical protein